MEFDHFEQQLNKKFKTFQPQADEAGLWENIETQLAPDKEGRRVGWLWLLTSASALIVIVVIWSVMSSVSKDALQEVNVNSVDVAHQELVIPEGINNNLDANLSQDLTSNIVVQEHEMKKVISQETQSSIVNETSSNKKVTRNSEVILDQAIAGSDLSIPADNPSLPESKVFESSHSTVIQDENLGSKILIVEVDRLTNLSHLLSYQQEMILIDKELTPWVETMANSSEDKSSRFNLSAGIGYSKIGTDVQLIDQSASNLLALRKQSEFQLEAIATELRLNYRLSDSWTLITGIHYNMVNTGSETTHSTSDYRLVNDTVAIVQSFIGVRYEEDFVPEITTRTSVMRRYNQFHNVSLPLGIAYQMGIGRQFSWKVGAIYELGLYNSNGGYEQDEGLLEYDISIDSESRFKTGGLSNILVETLLHKHFGERSSIFLGLQYRRGLSNIYNNNYSIKKRFDLFGLSTGISVSL